MRSRQRLFATVAALAVAFGAFWPLVSVARPGAAEIPSFICTQAGFQHQDIPGDHGDKFHCPLCVMTVDSASPPLAPVALRIFSSTTQPPQSVIPFVAPRFLAQLPPSRAPPSIS